MNTYKIETKIYPKVQNNVVLNDINLKVAQTKSMAY